jgi:hypothetical protein
LVPRGVPTESCGDTAVHAPGKQVDPLARTIPDGTL